MMDTFGQSQIDLYGTFKQNLNFSKRQKSIFVYGLFVRGSTVANPSYLLCTFNNYSKVRSIRKLQRLHQYVF